jgi:hypothetical protein
MVHLDLDMIFPFAAGLGCFIVARLLASWVRARRLRDLEAEPPRAALIALPYGENPHRRSGSRPVGGTAMIVACALLVLRPGADSVDYYLWGGFALLSLPGAWNDVRDLARRVTVRPVVAAHEEGLYLSGWRGTVFLPWREVALAYTDPPSSGGYVADEQKVTLRIESRSGRSWRYSSRDFAAGAPAAFDRLAALVTLYTAPPGSMLRRGTP